jgi:hypothetical protein
MGLSISTNLFPELRLLVSLVSPFYDYNYAYKSSQEKINRVFRYTILAGLGQ